MFSRFGSLAPPIFAFLPASGRLTRPPLISLSFPCSWRVSCDSFWGARLRVFFFNRRGVGRSAFLSFKLEWVRQGAKARQTKSKARLGRYEELLSQTPKEVTSAGFLGFLASLTLLPTQQTQRAPPVLDKTKQKKKRSRATDKESLARPSKACREIETLGSFAPLLSPKSLVFLSYDASVWLHTVNAPFFFPFSPTPLCF